MVEVKNPQRIFSPGTETQSARQVCCFGTHCTTRCTDTNERGGGWTICLFFADRAPELRTKFPDAANPTPVAWLAPPVYYFVLHSFQNGGASIFLHRGPTLQLYTQPRQLVEKNKKMRPAVWLGPTRHEWAELIGRAWQWKRLESISKLDIWDTADSIGFNLKLHP